MKISLSLLKRRFSILSVFFMLFVIDAVFRIREYDDKSFDFQVVLKSLIPLISMLLFASVFFRFKFSVVMSKFLFIFLFLFVLFLSSIYSIVYPYSLFLFISYFSIFGLAVYVALTFSEDFIVLPLFWSVFCFCIVSLYLYFFIPEMGRFVFWQDGFLQPSWRMSGLAGSANNFARIVGVALIFCYFYKSYLIDSIGKIYFSFSIILFVGCLLLSGSRTTIAFLLFVLIYSNFLRMNLISVVISSVFVFIAGLIMFQIGDFLFSLISRDGGVDVKSFTGRDVIWDSSIELIKESYLFGYGLGSSVELLPNLEYLLGFAPSHAHNMYLQLLLHGGVFLLLSFSIITLTSLVRLFLNKDNLYNCLLVFILCVGLFESGAFSLAINFFTFFYFLCLIRSFNTK